MNIFVDPKITFKITIKYEHIANSDGVITGVKILPSNVEKSETVRSLVCHCAGRDYDNMSKVLEESTIINHITGRPLVRYSLFCKLIVLRFVKHWTATHIDGNPIPIRSETVNQMQYDIIKAISKEWIKATS